MSVLPDSGFWHGRRVLITGHTGFKGSWLSLWLTSLGARVTGLALAPPTDPALFTVARVAEGLEGHHLGDIRDFDTVLQAMREARPELVIHMAAQPLVRLSYHEPILTYATNVMGTVHVLEAARQIDSVRAFVNVTSDKCYENREWPWGYREDEAMGGHDPYSSSKGCAELVTSAWRRSFFADGRMALASARSGNVIGGGDWAADRLIPDILRAIDQRQAVVIRNPLATRPWQHVLEPLSGYLVLAQRLLQEGTPWAEGWNFGPREEDARPVQWIVERLCALWGDGATWQLDHRAQPHEAHSLRLDIAKAHTRLHWSPRWNLATTLARIVEWQRAWHAGQDMRALCLQQILDYTRTPDSIESVERSA